METLASGIAAPANAEEISLDDANADATAKADGDGESATPALEPGKPAPKDKVQERFDTLTREKYDALRERDRKDYEIERLAARLAELEKAPTQQVAPANEFPTLEQFGYDEGKYSQAVAAHFSKIAAEQGKTAAQAALNEERERQQAEKAGQSWAQKEAELIKSKPEYVEKVKQATSLPISREIQQVLMGHDLGPQIALHMVENAEAAAAIMRLPLNLQLMEVGRISAKLEAAKLPPKPAVSQAPPPASKVETAEVAVVPINTTSPESDKLSDAAWVKLENARVNRKMKRA